jgi:hypothetical protein
MTLLWIYFCFAKNLTHIAGKEDKAGFDGLDDAEREAQIFRSPTPIDTNEFRSDIIYKYYLVLYFCYILYYLEL